MRQALLLLMLLSLSAQAASLCPTLIEKFAARPAVPSEFQEEIWYRFGPLGRLPPLPAGQERHLFLLSDLPEQKTFFEELDRSLAQTGNVGLTKRQEENLVMGTLGHLLALTTVATGQTWLGVLFGLGSAPLLYLSRRTEAERLELIKETQSVGVFRYHVQQQSQLLDERHPDTQIHTQKDFGGENRFFLLIACRVDSLGKPSTLVLLQAPRELPPDQQAECAGFN